MTSAYPATITALIPQARRLATELGELPSRNKLMAHLRIGAPKARQVLTALTETGFTPADSDPNPAAPAGTGGVRRLHSVPRLDSAPTPVDTADTADAEPSEPAPEVTGPESGPAEPEGDLGVCTDTPSVQVTAPANPAETGRAVFGWTRRLPGSWPLLLLALPAFVAIWSGWVGLGELTGFGLVHPLPGIADGFTLNTAITLPIGVETYAAYALRVALASGNASPRAKRFAGWSAVASLALGFLGQVAYHLMTVHHVTTAPWWITTVVSGLPVIVLGCGAALAHLQHRSHIEEVSR
jgi:hypothetical protein